MSLRAPKRCVAISSRKARLLRCARKDRILNRDLGKINHWKRLFFCFRMIRLKSFLSNSQEENMSSHENLIKIFEYALQQEETGKSFFQNSLQRMGMGAAISAFKRLIQEEENHILFIKKIIEDLKQGNPVELSVEKGLMLEPTHYFNERSKSEFLQQCLEGSMVPEVTIFNTAWLIEKDLSEFYEKMSRETEGKSTEALQMLSSWEKEHERFFREFRDKFSEVYSKMPWGG